MKRDPVPAAVPAVGLDESPWAALPRPWQVCFDEGWQALRAGAIPVGAAVVDGAELVERRRRYPDLVDDPRVERWQRRAPAAAAWGLALRREGWLTGQAAAGAPAAVVYDTLAARAPAAAAAAAGGPAVLGEAAR